MLTFILSSTIPEMFSYLEQSVRAVPNTAILSKSPQPDQVPELVQRQRPDGILLDISSDPDALLSVVSRLVKDNPRLSIFLVCQKDKCHQDLLLNIMRLGVREFFPIPFASENDFKAAVSRMAGENSSGNSNGNGKPRQGRMVCVISSKGGSGSTFIATSLAHSFVRQGRKSTRTSRMSHAGSTSTG